MKGITIGMLAGAVVSLAIYIGIQSSITRQMDDKVTALESRMNQVSFVALRGEQVVGQADGRFKALETKYDIDRILTLSMLERIRALESKMGRLNVPSEPEPSPMPQSWIDEEDNY